MSGLRTVFFDYHESDRGPVVRIFGPARGDVSGSCCVRVGGFCPPPICYDSLYPNFGLQISKLV